MIGNDHRAASSALDRTLVPAAHASWFAVDVVIFASHIVLDFGVPKNVKALLAATLHHDPGQIVGVDDSAAASVDGVNFCLQLDDSVTRRLNR